MSQTETKYLLFKGIPKKEQILFKSFLNLSKRELPYTVVIDKDATDFNMLVVDESYEWSAEDEELKALPALVIGDDMEKEQQHYLSRPVQWSDFKGALSSFDFNESYKSIVESSQDSENTEEELSEEELSLKELELPSETESVSKQEKTQLDSKTEQDSEKSSAPKMELSIASEPGLPLHESSIDVGKSGGEQAFEFELMNMSVDYKSVTNSEYERVANDVGQFNDSVAEDADTPEPVLLVADEESSFNSSVLVIETNVAEDWDIHAEAGDDESVFDEPESEEQTREGISVKSADKFWLEDNEIILDNKSLFYIKTQRDMVYSSKEPGHWIAAFIDGEFSKLPMKNSWRPFKGVKPYPIKYIEWINTFATKRSKLLGGLKEKNTYLLDEWPKFELLELDNDLLKLCSLLFVKPETVSSLVIKSKCEREQVVGFMNACQEFGLLTSMDEVNIMAPSSSSEDESVFGKIKDVFK